MKRLCILLFLIAIVTAGASYAEDQPGSAVDKLGAVYLVAQSTGAAGQPEVTGAENQPATEETPVQKAKRPRTNYGLMIGLYNSTSSRTRDIFGDNWVRYGIRPLPKDLPERWRPSFDASYYSMSKDRLLFTDKVTIIPLSAGLLRGFGDAKKKQTYVGVHVGPYYCDVHAPSVGADKKGWGVNTNATVGVIFRERLSLEARYELMNKFEGIDFSSFSVSASFKIFTAR